MSRLPYEAYTPGYCVGLMPPPYWRGGCIQSMSHAQHPRQTGGVLSRAQHLAGILPEHDPAAITRRGEGRERSLGPHRDLPRAGGAPELFNAIGVHGGAGAPAPEIATAGAEGVRPLDSDIT